MRLRWIEPVPLESDLLERRACRTRGRDTAYISEGARVRTHEVLTLSRLTVAKPAPGEKVVTHWIAETA